MILTFNFEDKFEVGKISKVHMLSRRQDINYHCNQIANHKKPLLIGILTSSLDYSIGQGQGRRRFNDEYIQSGEICGKK